MSMKEFFAVKDLETSSRCTLTTLSLGIDKTQASIAEASFISTEGMPSEFALAILAVDRGTTTPLQVICSNQRNIQYF